NHIYNLTGTGYAPAPGEDGVVNLDPSGRVTLHEGSRTYIFDKGGHLAVANGYAENSRIAASTCWGWDADGRLRLVHDPHSHVFPPPPTPAQPAPSNPPCTPPQPPTPPGDPPPPGSAPVPAGKLCKVESTAVGVVGTTTYHYLGGQLARIVDPGDPFPTP